MKGTVKAEKTHAGDGGKQRKKSPPKERSDMAKTAVMTAERMCAASPPAQAIYNTYIYRTCPVQTYAHAGTNLGRAAGRDLFREPSETVHPLALPFSL